jgi:hypothetical protein
MILVDTLDAVKTSILAEFSEGRISGPAFHLLASLPPTVLDNSARQSIMRSAQLAEIGAGHATRRYIRQALLRIVTGSSVKVSSSESGYC